jgi:ribonuclease P protein subunit POP4
VTPITIETLTRHEVIGLHVSVVQSSNPTHVGIKGKIIAERKNMFLISDSTKKRWLPKDAVVYSFSLPDKSFTIINGSKFIGKHAERIKKG